MISLRRKTLGFIKKIQKQKNSVEYNWNDTDGNTKTIKFDVYINYATGNSTLNFKSTGIANVLEGMNVILVPDLTTEEAKSNITELVKDAANIDKICLFYSFGNNPEAADKAGDDATVKPIHLTSTLWTLIYNFNRFEKYSDRQFENYIKSLTLVSPSTKLNQKRILYNIIGEKLFAEN